jgi:hypothetical protein
MADLETIVQAFVLAQNAIHIELCLRLTAPTMTVTSFGKGKLNLSLARHMEFVHRLLQLKEMEFGGA